MKPLEGIKVVDMTHVLTECDFSETEINLMLEQGIVARH